MIITERRGWLAWPWKAFAPANHEALPNFVALGKNSFRDEQAQKLGKLFSSHPGMTSEMNSPNAISSMEFPPRLRAGGRGVSQMLRRLRRQGLPTRRDRSQCSGALIAGV